MKWNSMKAKNIFWITTLALALATTSCRSPDMSSAGASSYGPETGLSIESRAALTKLTADVPAAAMLAKEAKGILVIPDIVKAGFIVGAWRGEGTLFKNGKASGY